MTGVQTCALPVAERRGVIEILAHRIGRDAALVQYFDRQRVGPPILVRPPEQRAKPVLADRAALCGVHGGLGVHAVSPLYPIGFLVKRVAAANGRRTDRKSTRLNSSH